jgi:hypothetical protein
VWGRSSLCASALDSSLRLSKIATFNFDLAGGMTGSGAVNIVSRRGGNELHGAVFFYFRDHNLAAYPSLQRDAREGTRSSPAASRG